jgi:hypothetical protein
MTRTARTTPGGAAEIALAVAATATALRCLLVIEGLLLVWCPLDRGTGRGLTLGS